MPAHAMQLDLKECLKLAIETNRGLKSAEAEKRAAEESIKITRYAMFPSLMLKSYYTLNDKSERLFIDADALGTDLPPQAGYISTGDKDIYGISLTLRQPLFTGGALMGAYRAAGHESEAAGHIYSRQARMLIFQVKKSYNEALIAESRIHAAGKAVHAAEEQLRVADARMHEGYTDKAEVMRYDAEVAQAGTRLLRARNRSYIVMAGLKKLIGADPSEELTVAGKPSRQSFSASLEELVNSGLSEREDLHASSERGAAAEAAIVIARSALYPHLFLEGSYLRQKETGFAREELWTMTVQAQWSLFEWGRTEAKIRRAAALRSRDDFDHQELLRSIKVEIEESWREVKEFESAVVAGEKLLKAQEASFEKIIDRYLEGAARFDEVLSLESDLWKTHDSYCQTAAALSNALANLEAVSASDLSRWITSHELYQPDFEEYSARIQKKAGDLPVHVISETHMNKPVFAASSKSAETTKANCRLQLGAYRSIRGAAELVAVMATRFNDKKLEIIEEGQWFKVLAGPYKSAAEGKKMATEMGLKDYLVR